MEDIRKNRIRDPITPNPISCTMRFGEDCEDFETNSFEPKPSTWIVLVVACCSAALLNRPVRGASDVRPGHGTITSHRRPITTTISCTLERRSLTHRLHAALTDTDLSNSGLSCGFPRFLPVAFHNLRTPAGQHCKLRFTASSQQRH
jgi:hypothetical protein